MRRREFLTTGAAALALAATGHAAAAKPFMSLSYTPSGVDLEAELARGVAETRIRLDIDLVRKYTGRIRTYTVDRGLDRVLPMAQQAGLKVSLGLYLGRDKNHNDLEIARGTKLYAAYGKIIDRIYVGNECLQRKDMSVAELINYVRRVRTFIANPGLQVGTAEAWYDWQKNRELGGGLRLRRRASLSLLGRRSPRRSRRSCRPPLRRIEGDLSGKTSLDLRDRLAVGGPASHGRGAVARGSGAIHARLRRARGAEEIRLQLLRSLRSAVEGKESRGGRRRALGPVRPDARTEDPVRSYLSPY
jgi:hypothetical protein